MHFCKCKQETKPQNNRKPENIRKLVLCAEQCKHEPNITSSKGLVTEQVKETKQAKEETKTAIKGWKRDRMTEVKSENK